MNKLGIILAGAALFDLGTVVVSSQAASADGFLKVEIDAAHTAPSCAVNGGTVITSGAKSFCQTRTTTAKTGPNAATKAPAKKEEAKKE